MPDDLSDFEKQRLANIAERDALLKKLSLDAQSAGIKLPKSAPSSTSASKPKKKPSAPKPKKEDDTGLVRRTSSRLRGIAADSEGAKRKADDAVEAQQQVEREKRLRKSDAFGASEMLVSGQKLDGDALIGTDVVTKGVAVPYERTFGDEEIQKTTDKDLRAVREEMSALQLWEPWEPNRIKITPERIYTMTFHPSETKPLIFAGDKMGHLGVLDASQEKPTTTSDDDDDEEEDDPDPILTTLKPHTRTISSMTIHPSKPTHLYTSSYDSSIREMDLSRTTSVEKYAPASTSDDVPISALDMAAHDPHTLYWTTLDGEFGRYDTRSPTPKLKNTVSTWRLSDKKIGGFSLCPSNPHYLATASLDRTMKLWDMRRFSKTDPEPVAVGEHQSRLSVSHAAFNAAGQVATSSYDDTLKIYDFGGRGLLREWEKDHSLSSDEMKPDTVVRHNCQTGRWVTILRPQWQQNPQSPLQRFCIGNMNRFVDIYSSSGDQLAQLGGDGITAVPAVSVFHRSKNWVAGGTASGKICLWM